jgi:hypothetical protein
MKRKSLRTKEKAKAKIQRIQIKKRKQLRNTRGK